MHFITCAPWCFQRPRSKTSSGLLCQLPIPPPLPDLFCNRGQEFKDDGGRKQENKTRRIWLSLQGKYANIHILIIAPQSTFNTPTAPFCISQTLVPFPMSTFSWKNLFCVEVGLGCVISPSAKSQLKIRLSSLLLSSLPQIWNKGTICFLPTLTKKLANFYSCNNPRMVEKIVKEWIK